MLKLQFTTKIQQLSASLFKSETVKTETVKRNTKNGDLNALSTR